MDNYRMLFILFFSVSYMRTSTSVDSLAVNQSIRDGDTLVSSGGTFEVGFFSPGKSTSRYLGIWYRNRSPLTIVWVANRETALQNKSGVLKVSDKGNLVILSGTNKTVWSSGISNKEVNNPIAQVLDTGNLVVKNGHDTNEDNFLWQSFDYPCNTLLPGMKLGWNLVTGVNRFLSSWKSEDDPAVGEYSVKIDRRGYPQVVEYKGSVIMTRTGLWNGLAFTGYPIQQLKQIYRYEFVLNEQELYFKYELLHRSIISIHSLTPSGNGKRLVWINQTRRGEVITSNRADQCENYALCGANSICHMDGNTPTCECLRGFVPMFPEQWNISYWSNGCVPRIKSDCKSSSTDGFWRYTDMKLPDTSSAWFSKSMNVEECRNSCLKNCSCPAYANLDIRYGGSGCLIWFDDLKDIRQFSREGQDLYIRVPASELDHLAFHGHFKKKLLAITLNVIFFGLIAYVGLKIYKNPGIARKIYKKHRGNKIKKGDMDLRTFDMSIIAKATENFSSTNKLGEGGFGPVYKGTLIDGQQVAVKRLSKKSEQGMDEFKNEVELIAKLQHRNLVKLLGCCIEGEEKMLIYEYMVNKSLDYIIFDETRRKMLDWLQCFNIIGGIARGLLYLHQDSGLRIIHRDLKTSNILLDANFDPKISDFGLARTFLGDQIEANTNKVAGTYGYMPPEYAVHGHFSMKSDVFSYGVIVLELITGKKNKEFSDPEHDLNLLEHAWRLWIDDKPLELLDEVLGERCTPSEVTRCIHVGLLCVQQRPEDRPDMSSVVLMLNGEKLLPKPMVPGFYSKGDVTLPTNSLSRNHILFSANELSIQMLDA